MAINPNDINGMNAFQAHQARVGNDVTFTRSIVESYMFLGFGTVARYADGRVDIICGMRKYTNVEVMVLGIDGWGIKPVPAVNDRVLLLTTQSAIPDLKKFEASGTMPAYDPSGLKAIPVTDADTAQLITVSKDGIEITGDNKLKINADGIELEDVNENKVTLSEDGVSFEDVNGNKVDTTDSGIAIEDKNKNKITTDDSGIAVEDKTGNKITTTSSGMTLEAKNGCKVDMASDFATINGKLKIKNS